MWALIAFILLGIVVASLIEINERIKNRKAKEKQQKTKDECLQEQPSNEDCSACELVSVCEKSNKE